MKDTCTADGCREIREAIVSRVKEFTEGEKVYVLLSGGIDSAAALFAAMEAGAEYKVINFRFKGRDSIDTSSVKRLQEKVGFDADYIELEPFCEADVREAVKICRQVFGRIREVKCETIYAMLQVKRHIPEGGAILCGYGGDDLFGYSRNDALLAARCGQDSEKLLSHRRLPQEKDEFRAAFHGRKYYTPFVDPPIQELITEYTTRACNERFPKSIIVRAFGDYFGKYKNARKPIGLHKGSCEQLMFDDTAKEKGFKNALSLFLSYERIEGL